MNPKLLEILVCPVCKGPLDWKECVPDLVCHACRIAYPVRDDIPVILPEEARRLEADEIHGN